MHRWPSVRLECKSDWVEQQGLPLAELATGGKCITQLLPSSKGGHRQPGAARVGEQFFHQLQRMKPKLVPFAECFVAGARRESPGLAYRQEGRVVQCFDHAHKLGDHIL